MELSLTYNSIFSIQEAQMFDSLFSGVAGVVLSIILTAAAVLLILLVLQILYILTLYRGLKITSPYHGMNPALVWLMLVPIFNLGWQFYVLDNITKGIKGKFEDNMRVCGDAGYNIGLAYCIVLCCSLIPGVQFVASPASLVLWIIYWVRIHGFNKDMEMMLM